MASGLNVIDIKTGIENENDFTISNTNFVVEGPADAFVIFRLPGDNNMLIDNSNVLVGIGGIGMNNIMFYTDQEENDTHFSLSNAIVSGVAFWSLGDSGGVINVSNAQGCTQLVADTISLDDVRFNRCSFGAQGASPPVIPEPATLALLAFGGTAVLLRRVRRKR